MGRTTDSSRRSTGEVPSPSTVATLPRRDRIVITGCILGVAALAWAYLLRLAPQMSSSADAAAMVAMGMSVHTPWSGADLFMTWVMWSVMMIGMMSASAAPVLLLFAETEARRARRGVSVSVPAFALGYLAIWLGFSAVAALAQGALHRATLLSPAMAVSSARMAGAILVVAGVYQLTPAKWTCLRHCQTPLGFLMSRWRAGVGGAFGMGARHGMYCLGCCWALMCVLFVVGVMNLVWVGALTVFVLLERFGRAGRHAARVGGVAMVAAGIFMVAGGTVVAR